MAALVPDLPMEMADVDFGEGPIVVKWRQKASLAEMDAIEQAAKQGNVAVLVEVLFQRARTDAGLRMFSGSGDKEKIRNRLDPDEVRRVVDLILDSKPGN